MTLAPRHIVALAANLALGAIALTDMAVHGMTGAPSVFSNTVGSLPVVLLTDLVHASAYGSLVVVLWKERDRFARANRFARALRGILIAFFGVLCVGFAVVSPLANGLGIPEDSPGGMIWGMIASIAFFGMILGSALLGFALVRTNPLGLGARVLLAVVPTIILVVVVALVAPAWAHPGAVEVVIGVGVSLLGAIPVRERAALSAAAVA